MSDGNMSIPAGVWRVKRKIRIPKLKHVGDAPAITHTLEALSGIKKVAADANKQRVMLLYDATKIDYRTIVSVLEDKGFSPSTGWWARLKGNWYQFTDSNARENAGLPPPACCNKPPKKHE